MARSTAGTRLRRQVATDIQTVRGSLDAIKRTWTPRGTVYTGVAKPGEPYMRPRRPEEYPENTAATIRMTFDELGLAIRLLHEVRESLKVRYHDVLATQQTEVTAPVNHRTATSIGEAVTRETEGTTP